MAMRGAIGQLDAWGYGEAADQLRTLSAQLDAAQQGFRGGTMTGEDFAAKLAEIQKEADAAFASLSDVDRAQFSGVISQLGRLGGVIASVTAQASALVGELAKAAQIDPGTKRLETMRQQHAAQQASMDSLNAMREANERFNTSEAARNALTSEGVKLEREKEAVRKRAAEAGATLTDQQITETAQAAIAADAARAAADRAGRSSGGGKAGGGAEKLDEFAREAQAIRDRTRELELEGAALIAAAAAGNRYGAAVDFAAQKARLLHAAQQAGKQITPALTAEVDQLAQAYVTAGHSADQAAEKLRQIEDAGQKGAEALSEMFTGILTGSTSAREALAGLLRKIAEAQFNRVFMNMFGQGGMFAGVGQAVGGWLGYSEGGFTGDGGKHEPAGIVHANEYVFSAEAVRRIGADNLDAMHRAAKSGARGYASGGLVGATGKLNKAAGESLRGSAAASAPVINITGGAITVNGSAGTPEQNADLAQQVARESEQMFRKLVQGEMVRQMRSGGLLR
ncbi:hypothetical protein IT40_27025 [Paracoccus versutus]|nr:hypothetical protein IT40_27025 [Paracoccus versutus]